MPLSLSSIVAAKRLVRKKLARVAARKYTWTWNQVIKEAQGVIPKRLGHKPPGFTGTNNEKYKRALLYKDRIVNYAIRNPQKYNVPIYRGIRGAESERFRTKDVIKSSTLKSFTTRYDVAQKYGEYGGIILRIKPSSKKLASINFTSGNFQSEFNIGGKKWKPGNTGEYEVLLPPGTFKVIHRGELNYKVGDAIYDVSFTPNVNT